MTTFTGFNDAVVIDIETTGVDPKNDRIVSIALIRSNFEDLRENPDGLSGDTMDAVVNPQCAIPKQATRIHGIKYKDVADKKSFSDIAQQLRNFIGNRPIIAHNVSFDKNFLNEEFKRSGVKTLARNRSFCTMRRYQEFNGGRRKGSNLDDVVEVLGLQKRKGNIHDALEDARLAWQVTITFYMMDNNIKAPVGNQIPPSRKSMIRAENGSGKQKRGPRTILKILGTIFLIVGLMIWLLY